MSQQHQQQGLARREEIVQIEELRLQGLGVDQEILDPRTRTKWNFYHIYVSPEERRERAAKAESQLLSTRVDILHGQRVTVSIYAGREVSHHGPSLPAFPRSSYLQGGGKVNKRGVSST